MRGAGWRSRTSGSRASGAPASSRSISAHQRSARAWSCRCPASYLEQFELRSIAPEPESEIATGDTVTYSFAAGTRQVLLQLEPSSIGLHSGRVTAGGVVEFDQMVWP